MYQQSQFQPQATSYQSSPYGPTYHNSQFVSSGPSSLTHSISYPGTDTSSLVKHNAYMASSSAPQIAYAQMDQPSPEYSPPEARLVVPVFHKGDDPIDAINHMMSFLTSVVAYRYPNFVSVGSSRPFTSGQRRAQGKQRVITCYNYKGEGHMSKQCTKPRRKRDAEWFKDKVLLVQAQANGQVLQEEELEFLADPAKIALMANLSHYGSDNIAEVNNPEIRVNSVNHQERHVQSTSEQFSTLTYSNIEIESDSNIIPYSQCLNETQSNTVQNSTLPALQDDLILNVIEQLKTQVVTCTKINQDNKQDDLQKEESRNIDRELALEKEVKELNNIVFKRNQSAQTVHMLTKPQVFYNHATRQALGFQNPRYLKKAQQLKPNLYDGSVIGKSDVIVVPDSEHTLMHAEESRSSEGTPQSQHGEFMLNKLKYHLASFDIVVKERTTATAITEGTWGFKHTKACFRDDIIPFVKNLKDLFTSFDQYLINEVSEVQKTFKQIEMAVEQNCAAKTKFQTKMESVLKENDRLLKHALGVDIVNIVVEGYRDNVSSSESAPTFAELFETNELKAQIQEKDTVILKLKEKIKSLCADDKESKVEDIETQNLELDHRVTKLTAKKNHLKQTYKQLFDSIKSSRVQSKEQCDDLINQVNLKSVEVADLNASLQERVLVITALKE
nr:reverse transcriptase zinc-binding domain-containing protein [Tanacetum cinerariifolium]